MPVNACRLIRKMRGGAQAHLVEADDGNFYVVKFQENPQHRRILVNELIASRFLQYLQIHCAAAAIVQVDEAFLEANPDLYIQVGSRQRRISPGWHFGSRFPGHPERLAVYDFLPDVLLSKVENLSHFLGVLVADKWLSNSDARQSVFFRARLRGLSLTENVHPLKQGFVAMMIDHGYIFDGPNWTFCDAPLHGLYFRPLVYEKVTSFDDFQPWLDRVIHFPEEVIDDAWKSVPPQWMDPEDHGLLEKLLTDLLRRRKRIPDLLRSCRDARVNVFPNWR